MSLVVADTALSGVTIGSSGKNGMTCGMTVNSTAVKNVVVFVSGTQGYWTATRDRLLHWH